MTTVLRRFSLAVPTRRTERGVSLMTAPALTPPALRICGASSRECRSAAESYAKSHRPGGSFGRERLLQNDLRTAVNDADKNVTSFAVWQKFAASLKVFLTMRKETPSRFLGGAHSVARKDPRDGSLVAT